MLTGKQRSYLKKLANGQNALLQIGKDGITEGFIAQLKESLEDHELIKINVLNNNFLEPKIVMPELEKEIEGIEFVQAIGKKLIVYKEADEEPEIRLP